MEDRTTGAEDSVAIEAEGRQITLAQAKRMRLILRLAFALLAFVTPMLIIGFKFQLFTQATHVKWSVAAIVLMLVVAWRFKKRIAEWINSWEDSNVMKHILVGIGKVWPFALVVALLGVLHWNGSKLIGDCLFCLEWTCVCELVAYLFVYPMEMRFDWLVKRMIRKEERKADYKEAIREMNQSGEWDR